jgi:hypothetical protein
MELAGDARTITGMKRTKVVALALLAAGCHAGTAPVFSTRYLLVGADDAALPAPLQVVVDPPVTMIAGGTLDLTSADSMLLVLHLKTVDPTGRWVAGPPDIQLKLPYARVGDSLVIRMSDAAWGGTISDAELRLSTGAPVPAMTPNGAMAHTLVFAP